MTLIFKIGQDLSALATQAAIELDQIRLGRSSSTASVSDLAVVLTSAYGADPLGVFALSKAVSSAGLGDPSTFQELLSIANNISKTLVSLTKKTGESPELVSARGFCIALAEEVVLAGEET